MAERMTEQQWNARRKSRIAAGKKLPDAAMLTLTVGDQVVQVPLDRREFSSGSIGYGGQVRGVVGDLPIGGFVSLTVSGTAPFKG